MKKNFIINIGCAVVIGSVLATLVYAQAPPAGSDTALNNSAALIQQGRNIFRYDTYGDEAFWGDALQLHQAIQGSQFGGVGPGVSPKTALALGLKVDSDALPAQVLAKLRQGQVDLDNVGVTLALLKNDAVVGVKGIFNTDGSLKSVGLTCAVCHSTVNDSVAPGVGRRLDGWANHDLNPGAIIAAVPNLTPIRNLLQIVHPNITDETIRIVLNSWGPGKFDAQLLFDGKAFRPDGAPAATLIPNAFGLLGHNLHTWTGGWGTVTYWNALKPENKGRFYHDGRFQTLLDVVNSYNSRFNLGLAPQESQDLLEYFKSL